VERQVLRCQTCSLVQYATRDGICRRCRRELPRPEVKRQITEAPRVQHRPLRSYFGAQLRMIRLFLGMGQGDLCKRIGGRTNHSVISRIENGFYMPSIAFLERMAEGFGLPLWMLVAPDMELLLKRDEFMAGVAQVMHCLSEGQREIVVEVLRAKSLNGGANVEKLRVRNGLLEVRTPNLIDHQSRGNKRGATGIAGDHRGAGTSLHQMRNDSRGNPQIAEAALAHGREARKARAVN
jgi:transcriptional regulator with XRE-family HTH domain